MKYLNVRQKGVDMRSPPAREAWIEISQASQMTVGVIVASREGGVD